MDKRTVHQLMPSPSVGDFCNEMDEGLRLTEDCDDLAKLLGRRSEEIEGKPLSNFLTGGTEEETVAAFKYQLNRVGEAEVLMSFRRKNGTDVWVINSAKVVKDTFGYKYVHNTFMCADKIGRMVLRLKEDVDLYRTRLSQTENKISQLQLRAEQDPLTKILNAGTTRVLAEEYILGLQCRCAMMVIDVDGFKRVNDLYGHMVGDEVMIASANAIKRLFRANDIVGRVGGDEFLVLMKDVSDIGIVETKCAQILEAFGKIHFDSMENEVMSCSVGAAVSSSKNVTYNDLFLCADKAMYSAKKNGGNRYFVEIC